MKQIIRLKYKLNEIKQQDQVILFLLKNNLFSLFECESVFNLINDASSQSSFLTFFSNIFEIFFLISGVLERFSNKPQQQNENSITKSTLLNNYTKKKHVIYFKI